MSDRVSVAMTDRRVIKGDTIFKGIILALASSIILILLIIHQGVRAHGCLCISLLKGGCHLEQGAELGGDQRALAHEIGGLLFSGGHLVACPNHLFTGQGNRYHMLHSLGVVPALDLQVLPSWVLTNLA